VLLSDGRQTTAGDVTQAAARLQSLNVPVFAVPIGSRMPPRDLSIVTTDAPEAVYLNDKAEIRAVIGTAGFQGQPLTVRLLRDGAVVDQQTVTPASDSAAVSFAVPSDQTGRFRYQLQTDGQPGELRTDNNSRELSLQIVDNKARVMLVEGDARWEFRYLKNLLDRDKQVEPLTVLFHQPYMEILNQSFLPAKLPDADEFRKQLATTDLLIVGDVSPSDAGATVWQAIEDAVARDGLTLLVIPGRRHMPHEFQSEILANLLPVTAARSRIAEPFKASDPEGEPSAFRMQPTTDGESIPMLKLAADAASSVAALRELPGHPWVCSGTPKPGATVWANATLADAGFNPEPVLVHHDYGFGQVVWLGLDSTWRWRRRAGDQWHYRFWGQLIRWAARNKSFAGDDAVRMTLTDVVVDESEAAEVTVRWDPRLLPQLNGATIEAVATPVIPAPVDDNAAAAAAGRETTTPSTNDAPVSTTSFSTVLQAASDAPEKFAGRLPRLPAGSWNVSLKISGGQLPAIPDLSTELLVMKQASAELANVSCNREFLSQLADGSGGRLVEPWEVEGLPALMQPPEESRQKLEERTLWDHWLLLPAFFTLLMSEWVIRKLHGLP
jgi:hypothetical protein